MNAITYTKQPDNTWVKSGECASRWVKIRRGEVLSAATWKLSEAVQIVDAAIQTGLTGQWEEFTILPSEDQPEPMSEEVKARLRAKKVQKADEEEAQ